jgi:dTDP-4-dehydrorhamnose 3,5-epimerase
MRLRPLSIEGAWEIRPRRHADARGVFLEWYREDRLAEHAGAALPLAQANLSVSARDVVRGVHFTDVPPGQAKYVTCVSGAVLDVVVDLRVGSPTFGRWDAVRLDAAGHNCVYLTEGLGHGLCSLTGEATVTYLCSTGYDPATDRAVHPLDPQLGVAWPVASPVLSDRDRAAPSLAELRRDGLLPEYAKCLAHRPPAI